MVMVKVIVRISAGTHVTDDGSGGINRSKFALLSVCPRMMNGDYCKDFLINQKHCTRSHPRWVIICNWILSSCYLFHEAFQAWIYNYN